MPAHLPDSSRVFLMTESFPIYLNTRDQIQCLLIEYVE